jgi:erythromycin esterase
MFTGCATTPSDTDIVSCVRTAAAPTQPESPAFAEMMQAFASSRLVGLGEATHGQHEAFELKRTITMRLIRDHGVRMVAYEASATRATACDDYISGRSDDLTAAMRGFGMMIWMVEENAQLLRELRAWNATATQDDRVVFVGIDVQDPAAAAKRLGEVLGPGHDDLKRRATQVASEIDPAVQALWAGDPGAFNRVAALAKSVEEEVEHLNAPPEADERAQELRWGIEMHRSPGGRDLAMAEMMKNALNRAGPQMRAVVWGHNGHVMRGPLTYLNSSDLAMGGHLGAAMGDQYYALGFVFGGGAFNALAQDGQGVWGFRAYTVNGRPPDAVADPFVAAGVGDVVVDLRTLPRTGAAGKWLESGHANIWFGGYRVPDDLDALARQTNPALECVPRRDFDGLAFLRSTTVSTPIKRERREDGVGR